MRLADVVRVLACEVVTGAQHLSTEVHACFAADLMSDVLASSRPDSLLLTGLTSVQSVHTADIADFRAVVFVGGKQPSPDARTLAEHRGVPLLVTALPMFEACARLAELHPVRQGA